MPGRIPSAPRNAGMRRPPTRCAAASRLTYHGRWWFPARAKTANPLEGASPVRGGTLEIPRSMSTRLPPSLRTNDLVEVWHGGEKLFYREGFRIPRKFMNRWAGNTEFDCGSTFILSFYVLEKLILVRYERIWRSGRRTGKSLSFCIHTNDEPVQTIPS